MSLSLALVAGRGVEGRVEGFGGVRLMQRNSRAAAAAAATRQKVD